MDAAVIVAFVAGGSALAVSIVGLVSAILSRPRRLQVEVEALQKLHGMLSDETAKQLYELIAATVLRRYGVKKTTGSASNNHDVSLDLGKYKVSARWGAVVFSLLGVLASVAALILGVVLQNP